MKPYVSSLILYLLFAAGLLFCGPAQAGQNPVSPLILQHDSLSAVVASKPAPVSAKEAPNWPALASKIAVGAEALMILFWSVLAGAFSMTTIAMAFAAMMAIGCFSMLYGLIRLRKMRESNEDDVVAHKKARHAAIWGAMASFIPIVLLLLTAGFSLLLYALIDI